MRAESANPTQQITTTSIDNSGFLRSSLEQSLLRSEPGEVKDILEREVKKAEFKPNSPRATSDRHLLTIDNRPSKGSLENGIMG
jgi:hypothetical protein